VIAAITVLLMNLLSEYCYAKNLANQKEAKLHCSYAVIEANWQEFTKYTNANVATKDLLEISVTANWFCAVAEFK